MSAQWFRNRFRNTTRRRNLRAFGPSLECEKLDFRIVPTYLPPVSFPVGSNPAGIAVGDFDNDGKDDLGVVNQTLSGSVSVLLSTGAGAFLPKVDYGAGASSFDGTAGDLNGDGKIDLVVVGSGVSVLLGNGDGTFQTQVSYAPGLNAHSVKLGDFDNDGLLDVATMNSGTTSVLRGNGDGTLQAPVFSPVSGNSINLVTGDFDHDGNLDVATSDTTSIGTVNVLKGRGDGSFSPMTSYYAFSAPVYLATGDFNNDGYDDFACPNSYAASAMTILLNNGDGTYGAPHTYPIGQTGYEIEVEDFDGDGNDDYAVRGGSSYMVHYGKGDGTFHPEVTYSTPAGRFEAGTHGDFDNDGSVDFAYPSTNGVTVVMNAHDDVSNRAGAVSFRISAPASTTSGSSVPLTISAVDADGNVVPGFLGTVYLTSSDPATTSATTYRFTAADAGTHAFSSSLKLVTLGTQTITASAPMMGSVSTTIEVTPAISKLAVSAPTTTIAGDQFMVTVSAIDALGNVATGYGSSIQFTSSDVQAGLPANYTFTPEDAGSHTFVVTLKSAGPRFISVRELGGTASGGATVNVTPGDVASLALAGGSGAIGVARPITIVALDNFGNNISAYTGTVHVTSSDPAAVLPADVALVNGVATVNVTLMTVGTQTITATDVNDSSITGTISSDATPPVPARFVVEGFPASTAGVAQNFTVTVRDTIGQLATGFVGTVYFSSSDIQAGLPASYNFTAADGGRHTFTATLKTAGAQSLSVRDSSGSLTGSQAGIQVTAAAFASYRLSVPNLPDSKGHILLTAGEDISLTVRATDAYGNTVTNYRGKAKFTSTDTKATVPTDYSFTAADAGVHTFNVALKTTTPNGVVWSYSVVDASLSTATATITNFEVTNAAASKFVISVPSNITAGTPFDLKVTVQDAFGNRVKNYFGTIHFSNTAGSIGLPEDYTFTIDDDGVHIFSVTLNTTSTQTITIFDVLTPTLTSSVQVTPRAAKTSGGGGGGKGK